MLDKAVIAINPEFQYEVEDGKITKWVSNELQPTEEQIEAKIKELEIQEK